MATTGLITPTNTGTAEEPILELAMLGRIIEEATCDTGPPPVCTFSYLLAQTPEITSISHTTEVNAGDTVTVGGTYNSEDLKTEFASLSATIGDESLTLTEDGAGTGFTFVMPSLVYGDYLLSLTHSVVG